MCTVDSVSYEPDKNICNLTRIRGSVVDPKLYFSDPDSDPIFVRVRDPDSDPDPL
jgi:hypothetical protein